jgi:ribosomal protein S19
MNSNIGIYNGISFQIVYTGFIDYKGYKLGEFSVSRKKPAHTGKRKQIKKIRNIIPKKKYF